MLSDRMLERIIRHRTPHFFIGSIGPLHGRMEDILR
jgi:hypothetical protein